MNCKISDKNMLRKKIKAFTIVELIVAMLVFSIVVSISVLGYGMVQKTLKISNNLYQFENELLLLKTALENDFDKAYSIKEVDERIEIRKEGLPMVIYDISLRDSFLRKTQSSLDTFRLNISDVIITSLGHSKYVKSLSFDVGMNGYKHTIYITKDYPSQFLFELENKK